ncbi:MAG: acetyl-CoA carboxylase biotin carboxyl carrier protein [Spirochaetaceae bacterium]|jgi:acetyl-CoA carboxylase biotin carboxyl carrier protein|nr:acetyl-CoA carboxylase biotin carboxyl carrier protein [Spirochaetaceae bacterium]
MTDTTILTLIDKFNESSLVELDLRDGTAHLILRKGGAFPRGAEAPAVSGGPVPPGTRLGLPVNAAPGDPDTGGEIIPSPIVATFYAAPESGASPFVKPGSRVKAGDTLCILEAMKMMNHLEAEFDCEILAVLAGNGDLVEYGQALFEVTRL